MDATAQTAAAALVGWALFTAVQGPGSSSFPSSQIVAAMAAFVVAETTILVGAIAKAMQESAARAEADRKRKLLVHAMSRVQEDRPLLSSTRFDLLIQQHQSDLADAIDAGRVVAKSASALESALRRFFLVVGVFAVTLVVTYFVSPRPLPAVASSSPIPPTPTGTKSAPPSSTAGASAPPPTASSGIVPPPNFDEPSDEPEVAACILDYSATPGAGQVDRVRLLLERQGFKVKRTKTKSETRYIGKWPALSAYYRNLDPNREAELGRILGSNAQLHRVPDGSDVPKAVERFCFNAGADVAVVLPYR